MIPVNYQAAKIKLAIKAGLVVAAIGVVVGGIVIVRHVGDQLGDLVR